jgi:hypothetical protein
MLRGIRAPGPPPLGAGEQLAWVLPAPLCIDHRAHQSDVGGWKRIGLAELAHSDVLSGPLAYPVERAKLQDRLVEASPRAEYLGIAHHGAGQ